MKTILKILLIVAMLAPAAISAQSVAEGNMSKQTVEKYSRISKELLANKDRSVPELMIIAAKQMLEKL